MNRSRLFCFALLFWFSIPATLLGPARAQERGAKTSSEQEEAQRERVAELLDLLEEQNADRPRRFKDAWCETLQAIIEIGPPAVPRLIEELDATDNDTMLRCLGFTLRAIGDKRAIPALIRAIPKTLRKPGSDMRLRSGNEEIVAFMQKHDLSEKDEVGEFDFCRPVREILGALQSLSGTSFEDEQLYHTFIDGTVRQQRLKREFFHKNAEKWAAWWEDKSASLVEEPYRKVNLPKLEEPPAPKLAKNNLQHYKTVGGGTGWMLESYLQTGAKRVFFDFDIERTGKLPEKWKTEKDLRGKFGEIEKWAGEEGFDLMGAEYTSPQTGKTYFALRPLRLQIWELGRERWKMESADITFESLISEGKAGSSWLLHRGEEEEKRFEPEEVATFLFRTKEGTPGLIFVGVEVHDDSLKPGRVALANEDLELSPIAFSKGRRFGFTFFEELQEK